MHFFFNGNKPKFLTTLTRMFQFSQKTFVSYFLFQCFIIKTNKQMVSTSLCYNHTGLSKCSKICLNVIRTPMTYTCRN